MPRRFPRPRLAADKDLSGDEETTDPSYADGRGFFKVEKWTKDDRDVADLLYAATGSRMRVRSSTRP